MTKNENNINELLNIAWELPKKELESEWTKSTLFLLPMVDVFFTKRKDIIPYIENCFIKDVEYEEDFLRPLFVLLKTKTYTEHYFKSTCNFFRNNPNYVSEYDVGEKDGYKLVMMVLQIPVKYKYDFYFFKQGVYSKLSKECKALYTKKTFGKDLGEIKNMAHHSSEKTTELKNLLKIKLGLDLDFIETLDELWDKPTKDREYYRWRQ